MTHPPDPYSAPTTLHVKTRGQITAHGHQVSTIGRRTPSARPAGTSPITVENNTLTADERRNRVIETATVRTGSQVAAAAVAGTAVGLAVGLGVGLAMSWDPDGDGKSFGDNIADAAESGWNALKGLFGG